VYKEVVISARKVQRKEAPARNPSIADLQSMGTGWYYEE